MSPKPSVGAPDVPNPKAAATKPEEILANAQAMLQGLRLSSVTASLPKWSAMRAASSTDAYVPSPPVPEAMGLLEGGATNPLRTALMDELDHAAMGGTRLWINRTGTLLSDVEVDPMVPMGCLASELRCNVTWEGSLCRVRHPGRGWLDITMIGQCPYVDRSVALDLIQELEISETHKRSSAVGLYRGLDQSMKNTVVAGREDDWLRDLDSAFFGAMASLFSDAPEDKVIEAIGTPSFWVAGGDTPWNRRLRRSMERSQGVLVHLICAQACKTGCIALGVIIEFFRLTLQMATTF